MANALTRGCFVLCVAVLWLPGLVQAQSCADSAADIEQRLFHDPMNHELRLAWLAVQQCRDAPVKNFVQHQQVAVWVGQDSNPLHSNAANTLWLTTSAGWLGLPNTNKPNASAFEQVNWQYQRVNQQQQQIDVSLQAKHYQQDTYDTQYQGSVRYQRPMGAQALLQASYQWVNISSMLFRQFSAAYRYLLSPNWSLGTEVRVRRFIDDNALDGNAPFVTAYWQSDDRLWWANYALGVDIATGDRAGGNQRLQEVAAGASHEWLGQSWDMMVYARQQQDEQGYSALLSYAAARSLWMQGVALQWRGREWLGVMPTAQLEYAQQQANIDLFEWQAGVLRIGIQKWW